MSDHYIHVIPVDPNLLPPKARREEAVAYFRKITADSDAVKASTSTAPVFVHCGANFNEVRCPACNKPIEIETWQEWMQQDSTAKGFKLPAHVMTCCGARRNLNDLLYDWPQGFARCRISAMNPNIGKLSAKQIALFAEILATPIRVIYEHV